MEVKVEVDVEGASDLRVSTSRLTSMTNHEGLLTVTLSNKLMGCLHASTMSTDSTRRLIPEVRAAIWGEVVVEVGAFGLGLGRWRG